MIGGGSYLSGNSSSGVNSNDTGVIFSQENHGFSVGQAIYHNGTNWALAIADSNAITNDSFATNIVSKVINANTFAVATNGNFVQTTLGLSGTGGVFLSQTVPGSITNIKPSSGYVQQLGWHLDDLVNLNLFPVGSGSGSTTSNDVSVSNSTTDYDYEFNIKGNRLSVRVFIKDFRNSFSITDFIPANIANYMDADYGQVLITSYETPNFESIVSHSFTMSKISTNVPETRSLQGNEQGEMIRYPYRSTSYSYLQSTSAIANIINGVSFDFNTNTVNPLTQLVQGEIWFYADLLEIV